MAAGTQYNKKLNTDLNGVRTPAVYDANVDEWMMLSRNYVFTGSLWVPQKANANGEALAQLTGSNLELYGATVVTRPLATAVATGAIFMAVDTQEMWQSNGIDWVVI